MTRRTVVQASAVVMYRDAENGEDAIGARLQWRGGENKEPLAAFRGTKGRNHRPEAMCLPQA